MQLEEKPIEVEEEMESVKLKPKKKSIAEELITLEQPTESTFTLEKPKEEEKIIEEVHQEIKIIKKKKSIPQLKEDQVQEVSFFSNNFINFEIKN